MIFTAIIKGTPIQVKKEAEKRGLDFSYKQFNTTFNQTVCDLIGIEENVARWFIEDNGKKAPFETGSLLFYRTNK